MRNIKKTMYGALIALALIATPALAHGSFSDENAFKNDVMYHMNNRENSITIEYTGDAYNLVKNLNQILKDAYTSEDYLSLSVYNISPKGKQVSGGIQITLDISYVATKAEEDYSDSRLYSITKALVTSNMRDADKVKAINDYIAGRYTYDYTLQSRSVYSALTTSKAVCQNYAMTAYRMLNYAGIGNRIVVGNTPFGYHAWNIVNIDGDWYNLDVTNNDANGNHKYFLVSDAVLSNNGFTWDKRAYPVASDTYEEPKVVDPIPTDPTPIEPVPINDSRLVSLATSAVSTAEYSRTDYSINKAKNLVNQLNDSTEKTELLDRIARLEEIILKNAELVATRAVELSEKYKTQNFIGIAESAIEKLPAGSLKDDLTNRINALKAPANEYLGTNTQEEFRTAEKAVLDAERWRNTYYTDRAVTMVAQLVDCRAKTELNERVQAVYRVIDETKMKVVNGYLDMAVNYKKKIYLDMAIKYSKDLKSSENINIAQARIEEVSKMTLK